MNSIIEKWEEATKKNVVLEFIHIMLMGLAQTTLNVNPICAVILIVALAVASPLQLMSCIWALIVATAAVYIFGITKAHAREGLYTINAALAGIAVPMVVYKNDSSYIVQILIFSAVASLLTVAITAALRRLTSTWKVSPLAIPYSLALALISCSTYYMTSFRTNPMFTPGVVALAQASDVTWTFVDYLKAVLNGVAQVIWIEDVPNSVIAGGIVLVGILIASRIDFLVVIFSGALSTAVAIACGIGKGGIMLGLYTYAAILISLVIFGRAFKMSGRSFILMTALSILSVFATTGLKPLFAVIGAPVAAFAWSAVAIFAMLGAKYSTKLQFVEPRYWVVPEVTKNAPSTPIDQL